MPNNKEGIGNPNQEWIHPATEASQEQQQYNIPHEELVKRFRTYITKTLAGLPGPWTPEQLIQSRLNNVSSKEEEFYHPLARAFDVIAYERYPLSSIERWTARDNLENYCMRTSSTAVKLLNPTHVKVMDALTEALDIPYEKGQTEISIPEKLQDSQKYIESDEFAQRLALAEELKKQRQP